MRFLYLVRYDLATGQHPSS